AEDVARQRQAAKDVGGDAPAGVPDDVGVAEVQAEDGEHVDAGVHAREDGEVSARAGVVHVGARRGVALVGGEESADLRHARSVSDLVATEDILDRRTLNRSLLARQHLLERASLSTYEMLEHLVGMQSQVPTSPYVGLWS